MALDYWCSLWFWPISVYDLLPSRNQFLLEMSLILTGRPAATEGTLSWVLETELEAVEVQAVRTLLDNTDSSLEVDELAEFMPGRLDVIRTTLSDQRFLHWPLVFADVLSEQSGFGLIVGNPPWVTLDWNEQEALAQYDPTIVLRRSWSADRIARRRDSILGIENLDEFTYNVRADSAIATFVRHPSNFMLLQGIRANTYKMFLIQSFTLISENGIIGLVHPIDHLRDPKGEMFRDACYRHLVLLLQFRNERRTSLFNDVHPRTVFAVAIYHGSQHSAQFRMIANLFGTETADESLVHDGAGPIPGIKDASGKWQLRGHNSRVIDVDESTLTSLGSILDRGKSPTMCRLPMLHSRELAASLVKITSQPRRLDDLKGEYLQDSMWNETTDRKSDPPIFKRETAFRDRLEDLILTGPIIGLANPLAKCPDRNSRNNNDYEDIDLTLIPDNYIPRSNYTPALPWNRYRELVRSRALGSYGQAHRL